eukprot:CAMPEP_0119558772 /NCGR_PEP_ID=MMETSP1352-20130426/11200_1 /TAXON_ID=265584 /ORGANISM="Stauroneis constricta, Strain CCMP1120" /LENGTH=593 /DNA_ID=CAMNT_0007606231 /DNA_START=62 /DNA_END=1843 /DNA_ORIENTATION=+
MPAIPFRAAPWSLLLLLLMGTQQHDCNALRHGFKTEDDDRMFIGPIGFPFGFNDGGWYNITIFDFDLKEGSFDLNDVPLMEEDEDGGRARGLRKKSKPAVDEAEAKSALDDIIGVGFLLKRFDDEAAFNRYMTHVKSNSSICVFADFLKNDDEDEFVQMDDEFMDSEYAQVGDNGAAQDGVFLNMIDREHTWKPKQPQLDYQFEKDEVGLYFLIYQICMDPSSIVEDEGDGSVTSTHKQILSTFELNFHCSNIDMFGRMSYLTAGQMILPFLFFCFAIAYGVASFYWFGNIRRIQDGQAGYFTNPTGGQPIIYPIHKLMGGLLILKCTTLFFESVRFHFIRVNGHAELWTGVFYFFAFLKGSSLFVILLLLGSGWSFVKPFLTEREKSMFFVVLVLQVINNIALIVLTGETEGERKFDHWTAILHIVDILCYCAILIPIVWHVNALEKNMEQSNGDHNDLENDNDEAANDRTNIRDDVVPEDEMEIDAIPHRHANGRLLNKLRLFRSFYLLVIVYIYMTRIVVYLLAVQLNYKHTWVRQFVVEAVTLAFYVMVGMQFRPMGENPYLTVQQVEDFNAVSHINLELHTARRPPPE